MPKEAPPVTRPVFEMPYGRHIEPPRPDHAPSRCPVCGRGDCPEDPPGRFRADWLVLILALAIVSVALAALAWWLGPAALDVLARGAGAFWP